jgi:hypothetical protein
LLSNAYNRQSHLPSRGYTTNRDFEPPLVQQGLTLTKSSIAQLDHCQTRTLGLRRALCPLNTTREQTSLPYLRQKGHHVRPSRKLPGPLYLNFLRLGPCLRVGDMLALAQTYCAFVSCVTSSVHLGDLPFHHAYPRRERGC